MKNQKGLALLELLVVIFVVGVIVLVIANLPNAVNLINAGNYQSIAKQIAAERVEYLRAQGFSLLPGFGATTFSDARLARLPSGQATQYVESCPDTICPDTIFNPASPDPVKVVKIKVTWVEGGLDKMAEVATLISDGGLK